MGFIAPEDVDDPKNKQLVALAVIHGEMRGMTIKEVAERMDYSVQHLYQMRKAQWFQKLQKSEGKRLHELQVQSMDHFIKLADEAAVAAIKKGREILSRAKLSASDYEKVASLIFKVSGKLVDKKLVESHSTKTDLTSSLFSEDSLEDVTEYLDTNDDSNPT